MTNTELEGLALKRGYRPMLDHEVIDHGDAVPYLVDGDHVYFQFAWANARGKTAGDVRQDMGDFFRSVKKPSEPSQVHTSPLATRTA